jgi:hypothetical protein
MKEVLIVLGAVSIATSLIVLFLVMGSAVAGRLRKSNKYVCDPSIYGG